MAWIEWTLESDPLRHRRGLAARPQVIAMFFGFRRQHVAHEISIAALFEPAGRSQRPDRGRRCHDCQRASDRPASSRQDRLRADPAAPAPTGSTCCSLVTPNAIWWP